MSEIVSYSKVKTIVKKLDVNTASSIITICDGNQSVDNIPGVTLISVNTFVKNLKAYARITSLPEVQLPDFTLEDTDSDKLNKILNVEWTGARKQLNLFITESTSWELVGSISLLNPSGYPYRMYQLMDLYTENLAIELGSNGKLGVQIEDVGYGGLTGQDIVTIHGSYSQEIVAYQPSNSFSLMPTNFNSCTSLNKQITNDSSVIIAANPNRKYLNLINNSDKPIWINLGETAEINKGILLTDYGSSFELSQGTGLYLGAISAISQSTVNLVGMECS